MPKLEKDIRDRIYIFNEEKNMREYTCSNLLIKEKEISFHKYKSAAVEIFNSTLSEYFTFTPQFERFEGFTDLFDYIEFWLKKNKIPFTSVYVTVDEMSALIYEIDIDNMALGKGKERISGGECLTYEYQEVEKSFFDPDLNEDITVKEWEWYEASNKEDDDDDDIDPQF